MTTDRDSKVATVQDLRLEVSVADLSGALAPLRAQANLIDERQLRSTSAYVFLSLRPREIRLRSTGKGLQIRSSAPARGIANCDVKIWADDCFALARAELITDPVVIEIRDGHLRFGEWKTPLFWITRTGGPRPRGNTPGGTTQT